MTDKPFIICGDTDKMESSAKASFRTIFSLGFNYISRENNIIARLDLSCAMRAKKTKMYCQSSGQQLTQTQGATSIFYMIIQFPLVCT